MKTDTIVAPATAEGIGAIAVVRLAGTDALTIADRIFTAGRRTTSRKKLSTVATHTAHFGTLRDPHTARIIDEVVATVYRAPSSYTREDTVEFSCHGSPYIVEEVLKLLTNAGARMADAGEFTLRAFLNGQLDLAAAEAVADLIAAESATAHALALGQMRGGFSSIIRSLRAELLTFAGLLELELDFGEEDVSFADRTQLAALLVRIVGIIRGLLQSFALGNVLKNGVPTVLAGRPNAGKSTLLNALLAEERALVSPIAGTTRDTIEETLRLDGILFRLIDTAGLRDTTQPNAGIDAVEVMGIARTREKIAQAALLVYIYDTTDTTLDDVRTDLADLRALHAADTTHPHHLTVIAVGNKTDEPAATHRQRDAAHLYLSARSGQNVDALRTALVEAALAQGQPAEGGVVLTNARHYAALTAALTDLEAVASALHTALPSDLLAIDLRRALHHLGTVTGEVSSDDVLANIFQNFCIGK